MAAEAVGAITSSSTGSVSTSSNSLDESCVLTYLADYLIIVFVGLVLVVLAAICLSAWCCRGECIMVEETA